MIDLECPDCGTTFHVRDSLKGGVANCPECRRLVEVRGTNLVDGLFHAGVGLAFLVAACIGAGMIVAGQAVAGLVFLGAAVVVGALVYFAM